MSMRMDGQAGDQGVSTGCSPLLWLTLLWFLLSLVWGGRWA